MLQVLVNGREVRANIIAFETGEKGFVDIEDVSVLLDAPVEDVQSPGDEKEALPTIQLPIKRLHGNVVVRFSAPKEN